MSNIFNIRLKNLGFSTYGEYLKSEHWKEMRKKMWASRFPKICCICRKGNQPLQIHHRSYVRLGKERLNDFHFLCGECHKILHNTPTKTQLWSKMKKIRKLFYK